MDITQRRRFQFLRHWFEGQRDRWLARHIPPASSVELHRRNIFILPTRQGMLFIVATLVIFVAAINYGLSLAFALAFLMVSVFLLGILHTFHNLRGLRLQSFGAEPGFAGETAIFTLLLTTGRKQRHVAIETGFVTGPPVLVSIGSGGQHRVQIAHLLSCRGRFKAPRVRLRTVYPLGLWQAWSHLDLDLECLVYPAPVACEGRQLTASGENPEDDVNGASTRPGTEDFQGLRDYQTGDSRKQIAWKSLARGQGLKVKQFVDAGQDSRILSWEMFPGLDKEARLSALCWLILQRSRQGKPTGLQMPGVLIPAEAGEPHMHRLLEVLARWP